jgi:hypothetical protein
VANMETDLIQQLLRRLAAVKPNVPADPGVLTCCCKGEQLDAHLNGPLKPVYVVYGDEPLLVIEAADAIRAAARKQGFDEREVLTALTGFDWNQLHHAAGNLSLFGGRKLLDLRIPTGKPGREGGAALQDYCQRCCQQHVARHPAARHLAST